MKTTTLVSLIIFLTSTFFSFGQSESQFDFSKRKRKGYRIKKEVHDEPIYANKSDNTPELVDWRKLDDRFYFNLVNVPTIEIDINGNKVVLQLITIPGKQKELTPKEDSVARAKTFPWSGNSVSAKDYDLNFWIDSSALESSVEPEMYKYRSDPFTGVLTAPFKYRLALGSSPESFIDGSFNVAQFIGWRIPLSRQKPYFISPFAFAGVTTISYNSSDNSGITDPLVKESGAGLTYGGGVAFRFNRISPGIVFGFDKGFGNLGRSYNYNDKLWISFSVNFDFFQPKDRKESKGN